MLGEVGADLEELAAATREFLARSERRVDLQRYRAVIDALRREIASSPYVSDTTGENAKAEE